MSGRRPATRHRRDAAHPEPLSLSVLLVEPDLLDAVTLRKLLGAAARPHTIQIDEAGSLREADLLQRARPRDVILCSIELPDATGLDVVRHMVHEYPASALVVMTRERDAGLGEGAVRMGAHDYVHKDALTAAGIQRVVRYARARIAARRVSDERYRRIIESAPEAVVATDGLGAITEWNSHAEALFGWSRGDMMGRSVAETLLQPRVAKHWTADPAACPAIGKMTETEMRHRDGRMVPVELSVSARGERESRVVIAFIRDISQRRTMEAQLAHGQKLESIGRLAGAVAHDFNNMLAAVLSFSELLLLDSPDDDPRRADVQTIHDAATRATGLTRQLLAFSRRQVFNPQVLELNTIVAGLDRMLRRLIGEDVELVTVFGDDTGLVEIDPGQFESALVNLAVNARDAMPDGGTLTLKTLCAPGQAGRFSRIEITDTGLGMTDDVLRQAFEPFFTTKGPGKGTGLGLASVYDIVRRSNGNINVRSAPGRGTTFTIDLPRAEAGAAGVEAVADRVTVRGTETILLAEDNDLVRNGVAATMRARGYTILPAINGEEAVRIARAHPGAIHLVLSDVIMPRMAAPQMLAAISAFRPGIRALLMSGYMTDSVQTELKGTPFLQKPFTSEALARKVRDVLNQPGPSAEPPQQPTLFT